MISCERSDMIFSQGRILSPFVRSCNLSYADLQRVIQPIPSSRMPPAIEDCKTWATRASSIPPCCLTGKQDLIFTHFCTSCTDLFPFGRWQWCFDDTAIPAFLRFRRPKRSDVAMYTQNNLILKKKFLKQKV